MKKALLLPAGLNINNKLQQSLSRRKRLTCAGPKGANVLVIPRKEVIQPQVPLRLPCYDLVPVTELTVGSRFPEGLAIRLRVLPTPIT